MRQTSNQLSTHVILRGRLSPLTPWSKFPPPLPFPLPFPSILLPFLSLPLEVGPLLRLGGLGERFSSPSGSGRSPAAKRYLVNFRLKISPLATIFRSFSGNETSNYADKLIIAFLQKLRGESALIINALRP